MNRLAALVLLATLLLPAGCGYRISGNSSHILPPSIKTIAVPAFENQTLTFKIEQNLTAAVVHEFLTRTPYRVQSSVEGSDAN